MWGEYKYGVFVSGVCVEVVVVGVYLGPSHDAAGLDQGHWYMG